MTIQDFLWLQENTGFRDSFSFQRFRIQFWRHRRNTERRFKGNLPDWWCWLNYIDLPDGK